MSQTKSTTILQPKQVFVGAKTAMVTLVEFGDYESSACADANSVVKELLEHFDGELKFVFRHFPLSQIHQKAMKAAEAAVAAAQTGKFWEMHNMLLENRKHLGLISLKEYAKEIGITDKRFLTNLFDGVFAWYVRQDLLEGLEQGVREIPAFFINGKRFSGEPTFENLQLAIGECVAAYRNEKTNT
jgi:protein-disulfide isomerase